MKKLFVFILIFCAIFIVGTNFVQPIIESVNFPEYMYVTFDDIKSANESKQYSGFKFSLPDDLTVSNKKVEETTMDIKLFGWLPIKKIKVKLLNDVEVFAGGNTVGFHLTSDGVQIVGSNPIWTADGKDEPFKECCLQEGDYIQKINGQKITNIDDIDKILNSSTHPEYATLSISRKDDNFEVNINPALDLWTKKYKLGLWVQNSTSGVGTLTYVKKSDYRFGAVGHPIPNLDGNTTQGEVYLCNFIGIKKGTVNAPGEIQTSIKLSDTEIGRADTNCEYGVYGNLSNTNSLDLSRNMSLGGRMSVELGDAQIFCDIDGEGVKGYDIKIVKTNHQNSASEKSIMFRVTDQKLLDKSGGIIQGMSGSPIIQNGKLVGAVTHVFLNDPTKAFGVYIDWMIEN